MSRALLILRSDAIRAKAIHWISRLPEGTRVEFKEPQRSLDQNAKMWAGLTDIAAQATHAGRKWSTDQWKCLFLCALGRETQFIPSLDGQGFIPYGQSSSDLSKKEMTDLIELMQSWGAEHGVTFHEPSELQKAKAA